MAQLNINVTKDFQNDLDTYMRARGIRTKSDAIKLALHEAVLLLNGQQKKTDFRAWLGTGLGAPVRTEVKFQSEDDLWKVG